MSALEQFFAALTEAHDLTSLSVGAVKCTDGAIRFNAAAHWDGFSRTGHAYNSANGSTLVEAINDLLDEVALLRTPRAGLHLADEPLPVEG